MSRNKHFGGLILLGSALLICLVLLLVIQNRNNEKRLALFSAAGDGNLEKVRELVQKGSPINRQVDFPAGWTPLINAIFHNKSNVVEYLVAAGANVNLADRSGRTPLMWVTSSGDQAATLLNDLIAHGANVNAKDMYGSIALDYARGASPNSTLIEELQTAAHRLSTNR